MRVRHGLKLAEELRLPGGPAASPSGGRGPRPDGSAALVAVLARRKFLRPSLALQLSRRVAEIIDARHEGEGGSLPNREPCSRQSAPERVPMRAIHSSRTPRGGGRCGLL
ncbi:hypothetical protein MTO96_023289 [Rhipicephalus appendiculatus]